MSWDRSSAANIIVLPSGLRVISTPWICRENAPAAANVNISSQYNKSLNKEDKKKATQAGQRPVSVCVSDKGFTKAVLWPIHAVPEADSQPVVHREHAQVRYLTA